MWNISISCGQLFVKQSSPMGSIQRPTPTISTANLLMSPTVLPPDRNIMDIVVVRENNENSRNQREKPDIFSKTEHQPRPLPAAAALSSAHSLESLNKNISSLSSKDPLHSSNAVKASASKSHSYHNETIVSSKINGQSITSKMTGN